MTQPNNNLPEVGSEVTIGDTGGVYVRPDRSPEHSHLRTSDKPTIDHLPEGTRAEVIEVLDPESFRAQKQGGIVVRKINDPDNKDYQVHLDQLAA